MIKEKYRKLLFRFLVLFLFFFMIMIFGPAEIFFANLAGFEFVYGEFAGYLALAAVGISIAGALILSFMPDFLDKLILSVMFGISVAGYIQVMFLNKQLDLLGQNPDGYRVNKTEAIINAIIWLIIIVAVIGIAYSKDSLWKKILGYMSAFLLAIQGVALVSLLLTAEDKAFEYPEGVWYLSGKEQFVVSARENVIVLVLDYYSNQYIEMVQERYPDAIDFMNDFTYYSNADATYFGTFPSMTSTYAGVDFTSAILIDDWCKQAWTNEKTINFYDEMRKMGYKCNLFTTGTEHMCGTNDRIILKDCFSNLINTMRERDVFYKLLFKTMTKMSCYRFMPEFAKPMFYTAESEYAKIISYDQYAIVHNNYEFYDGLLNIGLSTDEESNHFIIQHLSGGHEYNNDANCMYSTTSNNIDTYKGAMVMVEEYLNQLKELGVYDDATIIVTSDHGNESETQVIFFVKEAGETHERMRVTNAPITLRELLPTVAKAAGIDYEKYGSTIFDFAEDEMRERSVWIRDWDGNYDTSIVNYDRTEAAITNVYKIYTYIGDYSDLKYQMDMGIYEISPMLDSFYVY